MKSPSQAIVHELLATHLGIESEAIENGQHLDRDLGLDPLDLVLLAMRLEDLGPDRGDFPIEQLDPAMTVRQLAAVFQRWSRVDDAVALEEEAPDTARSTSVAVPSSRRLDLGEERSPDSFA